MELLSPAGSFLSLKAAILNGADAVYFSGGAFNARINAENFTNEELIEAIDYCRSRNTKAYITLNTLIYDSEFDRCLEYARFLYSMGANAFIVQDLGLLFLLKKYLPDIEYHASTQMGISSLDGVKLCEKLGISQVVLSRELSLKDIRYISENTDVKLECFVHGAMCVSFSGGCLFSSLVGGRSGNRGECAQPCRKRIAVGGAPKENDYNLSIADMCMIEHIKELKDAGISSLKIEGRMKKPEYVAMATYAYRRAIDGAGTDEIKTLKKELEEVFSRGEFSCGYYFGADFNRNAIAKAQPSKELQKRLQESYRKEKPIFPLEFKLILKANENAKLIAQAREKTIEVTGSVCEAAKSEIDENTVSKYENQLKKLGDTPYYCDNAEVIIENAYLPVSKINEMRRKAVELLEESTRLRRSAAEIVLIPEESEKIERSTPIICARVIDYASAIAAYNAGADEVTIDALSYDKNDIEKLFLNKPQNSRLNISLPIAIIGKKHERILYDIVNSYPFNSVEINNLGQVEGLKHKELYGGAHLNIVNSHTINSLLNMGLKSVTISPELTRKQCKDLIDKCEHIRLEVFGRATLMNLFNCPVRYAKGCQGCEQGTIYMNDEQLRRFPILKSNNIRPCAMVRILNCFTMDNIAQSHRMTPYAFALSFYDENAVDIVNNRINALLDILKGKEAAPLENTTRGYWNR